MTGLESQLRELNSFKARVASSYSSLSIVLLLWTVTNLTTELTTTNKGRKHNATIWIQYKKGHQWYYLRSTFAEASTIQRPSNGGLAVGVRQTLVSRTWGISFSFWSFHPDSRPENLRSLIPLRGWRGEGSKSSWFRYPVIIFFHLDTTLPRQFHLVKSFLFLQ